MNKLFSDLLINIDFVGDVSIDSSNLLSSCGFKDVAEHSIKVANEAKRIAGRYGVDEHSAFLAGILHDVGNIFPNDKRVEVCNELGIEVLQEERLVPSLLHPKISKAMAASMFGILETSILSAIECHSTLKANATKLDITLFIADKLSWDSNHNKTFIDDIIEGLGNSLELGAFTYLRFMIENKEHVKIIHPWALEAYNDLKVKLW